MTNKTIFVIGRSLPETNTGMIGIFEYEHAKLIKDEYNSKYIFIDNRSIKSLRKIGIKKNMESGVEGLGLYLPIGGLPKKLFKIFKYIQFRLVYLICSRKFGMPDIVHFHYPLITSNEFIIEYLLRKKVRIYITEHWSKVLNNELDKDQKRFLKYLTKKDIGFLCVGAKLKESIVKITGANTKLIGIIPNFVDEAFFTKQLPSLEKTFNYYFSGRLTKNKNVTTLIKAFHLVSMQESKVQLNIFGDGEELSVLINLVKELNILDKVTFHGFIKREDMPKSIQGQHVYISASSFETFGVPIIESMAMGMRIIIPEGGPLDDFVLENHGMTYKDVYNYEALSQKMLCIKSNYKSLNSHNIRKNTLEQFSGKNILKKYEDIYTIK
ncbi:glycosyltransferase family 4 protein [Salinicoccus roseus]|uniref:glycosyltransferase family 4 protein n=1 Tax=Salinicoccus roseus TaxID=45670 RepID=UPI001EF5881A|nr:glycosyltransferase family 4 protein [Salinicoccus roseus]MCG7333059.1 glycosyltransferase family 4 protein [Salinicoccus roseus]